MKNINVILDMIEVHLSLLVCLIGLISKAISEKHNFLFMVKYYSKNRFT